MSVYRVYLPEWEVVYISQAKGSDGKAECEQAFAERWKGKVDDADMQIVPVSAVDPARWQYWIRLKLPNLKAEYSYKPDAEREARGLGNAAIVLERWSRDEEELLSYGKRSLRE